MAVEKAVAAAQSVKKVDSTGFKSKD